MLTAGPPEGVELLFLWASVFVMGMSAKRRAHPSREIRVARERKICTSKEMDEGGTGRRREGRRE